MNIFVDILEEATFTKSHLGGAILLDSEGYSYCQHRAIKDTVYWRCIYHYKSRGSCPAKARTEGFFIKLKTNEHKHKPHEPIVKKPHGNSKLAKLENK